MLPPFLSFPKTEPATHHQQVLTMTDSMKTIPTTSSAPFTFLPSGSLKSFPTSSAFTRTSGAFNQPLTSSNNTFLSATSQVSIAQSVTAAPFTTLSFGSSFSTPDFKIFDFRSLKPEGTATSSPSLDSANISETQIEMSESAASKNESLLVKMLKEKNQRSETPLSVELSSPANSVSEPPSPLSSPNAFDDSNTQATLIERSADLQIRSDTIHAIDDEENASFFDLTTMGKRPSAADDTISSFKSYNETREKEDRVPMKIAKPTLDADPHSIAPLSSSPDPTFDIGSVVSSTSSFSFGTTTKDDASTEVFTFGSGAPSLNEPL